MPFQHIQAFRSFALYTFLILISTIAPISTGFAGQLTLAWDANTDPELGGYKVYYGQTSKSYSNSVDVGNQTSYTLSGLQPGQTYYFAATAYANSGASESDFSNEISETISVADFTADVTSGPVPLTVGFSDLSTNNVTSWQWSFGDGTTSSVRNPSHTYAAAGVYSVSLTVIGPGGSNAKIRQDYITVSVPNKPAPVADFTADVTSGEAPLMVNFSDSSTGNIDAWNWDFGDGGTSTGQTALYSYAKPGIYDVSLTVSGPDGSNTKTRNGYISVSQQTSSPPIANFSADVTAGPAPLTVKFSDSSTGEITTWKWHFGDGGTSSAKNPDHTYTAPGDYLVSLSVSGPGGSDTKTRSNYISVSPGSRETGLLEVGEVAVNQEWKRVAFVKSYLDPVVVAKPLSRNDSDPAVVRIRNVDDSGFEIRAQEWDYLDGDHALETVGYLVMESGRHVLPDGTQVEAGRFNADNADSFATHNFAKPFSVTPVVLAAVTSHNEVDAVVTRLRKIEPQSFKYQLQEQELNASIHDEETLSYIAWEPSVGVIAGVAFEVGRTADVVSHRLHTIQYQSQFTDIPVFLADMQTADGRDTANVSWLNKGLDEVDVQVVEEQSLNDEMSHTSEVIGFMLFSSDAESSVPMEFGEVDVDQDWTWVALDKGYVDPVVVAKPLSRNVGDPATVRIRNVNANGFEIRVQEWDYLDDWHAMETVGYLVMERGRHVLPDGTQVEAGRFNASNVSGFATANFIQPFGVAPVVLAAVTSNNEVDAVVPRLRNVGPQGFDYQLQEQELNNKAHDIETVSYIAWEPSMGTFDDVVFEVGRTGNRVKDHPYPITYQSTFSDVPVFLADMQTRDGADPATVGWLTKDIFGIDVQIVEEQSLDNETAHTTEDVGYILVAPR